MCSDSGGKKEKQETALGLYSQTHSCCLQRRVTRAVALFFLSSRCFLRMHYVEFQWVGVGELYRMYKLNLKLLRASSSQIALLCLLEAVTKEAMETTLFKPDSHKSVVSTLLEVTIESQLKNIIAKDTAPKLSSDFGVSKMFDRKDCVWTLFIAPRAIQRHLQSKD